jgi:hypothetical protein
MAGSAPYKATANGSKGLHKDGPMQSPAPPSKQICPPSKLKVSGKRSIGGKR